MNIELVDLKAQYKSIKADFVQARTWGAYVDAGVIVSILPGVAILENSFVGAG
jgi:acetyltransferase-like isoleucine patch superfamily enzyme